MRTVRMIFVVALAATGSPVFASDDADLIIRPSDIIIEQSLDGGYDLWVKKRPGLGSILLTESTADPAKKLDSYALRDPDYHAANGDETRILDGKILKEGKWGHSLIDSTPEPYGPLGEAFHIFIPYVVVYGYPWSR